MNDFLEKTLEDIVFENKNEIHLYGLPKFKSTAFRQVILPSGRKIDILGFEINNGHLDFDIYELKRDFINIEAVCQAYNYLEEIKGLIKGHFKSWGASIIMVGKRYDPISVLDAMSLPINVYTYDYQLTGISFSKQRHGGNYYSDHKHFSLGLWAFGTKQLSYNNNPSSIAFHSVLKSYISNNNVFENSLSYVIQEHFKDPPLLEIQKPIKQISTVIFPEQPSWTLDFAKDIPHYDLMEDMDEDMSDFEDEEIEADYSDYEPEPDLEEDNYYNFVEPINWYDWEVLPIALPRYYYVLNPNIK